MINLPSGVDLDNLVSNLRAFSWEASEIFLYYSQILKDSKVKSNIIENDDRQDPVTIADLKVNELIINKINEKYQNVDWEILSEENIKLLTDNRYPSKDWLWILDPLDGTKDFIQGTGNYAMHLALNYKNKPFLGIVLIPERDELWFAMGQKVWCERKDESFLKPNFKSKENLSAMTVVTSKNHRNENLNNLIHRVGFEKVVNMGSIGCKVASILRGESDIYVSLSLPGKSAPKDWDFAAPEAILWAAGGAITNLDNEKLSYGKLNFEHGGIIVASNSFQMHEKYCLKIKEIVKRYKIYPL